MTSEDGWAYNQTRNVVAARVQTQLLSLLWTFLSFRCPVSKMLTVMEPSQALGGLNRVAVLGLDLVPAGGGTGCYHLAYGCVQVPQGKICPEVPSTELKNVPG